MEKQKKSYNLVIGIAALIAIILIIAKQAPGKGIAFAIGIIADMNPVYKSRTADPGPCRKEKREQRCCSLL